MALKEFLVDNDQAALLRVVRLVAQAQGGMGKLSRKTRLSRASLYKALSSRGNPRFHTIGAILAALGYRLSIVPIKPARPVRARKRASTQKGARSTHAASKG